MAMVALSRYAHWTRQDIRDLTMAEFEGYAQAAQDLEEKNKTR